ncbi:MAG: YbhB/YbcL family Raf kinase inhibitor-like protein [Acidimicrobiia bacterium]
MTRSRRRTPIAGLAAALSCCLVVSACGDDSRTLRPAAPDLTQSIVDPTTTAAPTVFTLSGPWVSGTEIDKVHTCIGADTSPALRWSATPTDAVDLAIVATEVGPKPVIHWVVTGIDPIVNSLAEGRVPDGTVESINDFGKAGWSGPCPALGFGGTLTIELLALRSVLAVTSDTPGTDVIAMARAAAIATATYTGTVAA